MASAKLFLRKSYQLKDGTHPVVVQLIHNRKSKILTIFTIEEKYWDEDKLRVRRSYSRSIELNNIITKKYSGLENRIFELEAGDRFFTLDDILSTTSKKKTLTSAIKDYQDNSLIGSNVLRSRIKYENLKKHIENFKDIPVTQVNTKYFNDLKSYMLGTKHINSTHTVARYLKALKTVMRNEFKKGVQIDVSVLDFKMKTDRVYKLRISEEQIESLRSVELNETLSAARDAALLCYDLWGTRIGDVLMLDRSNIIDNRVHFVEQKTGKVKSIEINENISKTIDRYSEDSEYLLPILDMTKSDIKMNRELQRHIESKTTLINRYLKVIAAKCDIEVNLSTHVMRHSFSAHAIRAGATIPQLRDMLNHSTTKMTENYIKSLFRDEELDELAKQIYKL